MSQDDTLGATPDCVIKLFYALLHHYLERAGDHVSVPPALESALVITMYELLRARGPVIGMRRIAALADDAETVFTNQMTVGMLSTAIH